MASACREAATLVRRMLIGAAVLAVVVLAAAVVAVARPDALPRTTPPTAVVGGSDPTARLTASRPQVVEPEAGIAAPERVSTASNDARRVDDAQIRRELDQLKELAAKDQLTVGSRARVLADGRAVAPASAPQVVRDVIRGANVIATTPYLWGGGHGSWSAVGYDCSGSVSFALANAGLLGAPLVSGELAGWGAPGRGRWITIYANDGHVFMEVAGLRFDTGGLRGSGTRWQTGGRSTSGFTARHPAGL
jgi:cell wall-associated NlpC family hydrolase